MLAATPTTVPVLKSVPMALLEWSPMKSPTCRSPVSTAAPSMDIQVASNFERALFEAVGRTVSRLIRVRYGPFYLPPRLKRGQSLQVDDKDVEKLVKSLGAEAEGPTRNVGQKVRGGRPGGKAAPRSRGQARSQGQGAAPRRSTSSAGGAEAGKTRPKAKKPL